MMLRDLFRKQIQLKAYKKMLMLYCMSQ